MAKAVAKRQAKSVPAAPGTDDFAAMPSAGMENVTADDLLIPRLSILQSLSPQLKKSKAEYIEGAEEGQICDIGTGDLFAEGVLFLPVYYVKQYLQWAPRDSGKGLIQIHTTPDILQQCKPDDKGKPTLDNGDYIAETAQFFGMNLSADRRKCFIPMTSTQLKKARQWLTMATGEKLRRGDGSEFTPPLFYRSYGLTTGEEVNNQGEWFGWKIERNSTLPELFPDDFGVIMEDCKTFLEHLLSGSARGDTRGMYGEEPEGSAEGAM